MRRGIRCFVLSALVLAGAGCAGTSGEINRAAVIGTVISRVETIRDLTFRTNGVPSVSFVARARLTALSRARIARAAATTNERDVSEGYLPESVIQLLDGVVRPHESGASAAGLLSASLLGEYFPENNRIYLANALLSKRGAFESVLSHEVDHALEAQNIDPEAVGPARPLDAEMEADRAAVREGAATLVQIDYDRLYQGNAVGLPYASIAASTPTGGISDPARLADETYVFRFASGTAFVESLHRDPHNWDLVNAALRRPPAHSVEILDPRLYPAHASLARRPAVRGAPTNAWIHVGDANVGAQAVAELLGRAETTAEATAASTGWRGGWAELWVQRGASDRPCVPCRDDSTLLVTSVWQHVADASRFRSQLDIYLSDHLDARRLGSFTWKLGSTAAAVRQHGDVTAIAFAPSLGAAEQFVARAVA
jgi:hypothetical protein